MDLLESVSKPMPKPKDHYFTIESLKIEGVEIPRTEIKLTKFSNRFFFIITQNNKLGAMIKGEVDNPTNDPLVEKTFETSTLLGGQEREVYEVYCRTILEKMNDSALIFKTAKAAQIEMDSKELNPLANKPLLLSINLKKVENDKIEKEMFKVILAQIEKNLIFLI